MTRKELEVILGKVENVEALTKELQSASDVIEVKEILKKYDVDINFDEIELCDEELDGTELEEVSGGICSAWLAHGVHEVCRWLGKKITGKDFMGSHC